MKMNEMTNDKDIAFKILNREKGRIRDIIFNYFLAR